MFGWLKKLFGGLKKKIKDVDWNEAERRAKLIFALTERVVPYARWIANVTPTPLDNLAVAAIEEAQRRVGPVQDILAIKDRTQRRATIEQLIIEAVKAQIHGQVADGKIEIGGLTLKMPGDLKLLDHPVINGALEAAVKQGFEVFVREEKVPD
jgi:hypothetical protein